MGWQVGGSLKVCVREVDDKAGRLIVSEHDAKSYEVREGKGGRG